MAQFHVATSYGYKVFKTECIDDMPFEQFRVLVAMLEKTQQELADTTNSTLSEGLSSDGKKQDRTIFRITDEA